MRQFFFYSWFWGRKVPSLHIQSWGWRFLWLKFSREFQEATRQTCLRLLDQRCHICLHRRFRKFEASVCQFGSRQTSSNPGFAVFIYVKRGTLLITFSITDTLHEQRSTFHSITTTSKTVYEKKCNNKYNDK